MDLSLSLEDSLVVITGAAGQIGQVLVNAFLSAGCIVGGFDKTLSPNLPNHPRLYWHQVDITDEFAMIAAFDFFSRKFGNQVPTICVCAAGLDLSFLPECRSIIDMPVEDFRRTIDVNVTGTFITAKTWLKTINGALQSDPAIRQRLRNVSCIVMGSEAGVLGVPGHADYAASKSAIQYGLVKSLAVDAARVFDRAIVNAVAPGAVDTTQFKKECAEDEMGLWREAQATVVTRRPVAMEHVARMCLMLASETWSGSTTGQVVRVDGGESGRLFWLPNGQPVG